MFRKSIEAVIADGISNLERLKKEAAGTVTSAEAEIKRCQSEIQSLVNLGKQVPEKIFDRYSNVLVTTFECHDDQTNFFGDLRLNGNYGGQLRGIMGDEVMKKGKYRAIVLLERIS